MSLPLAKSQEIIAHKISLIQGNAVVDIVDLLPSENVEGDLAALTATVAANTTAIAGKQDPLDNLAGSGASLLSKPANMRRLAASNGPSVGMAGGEVVVSGASLESAITAISGSRTRTTTSPTASTPSQRLTPSWRLSNP